MRTHFTTGEVARILDVSVARFRSCLRASLLSGGRHFTFQDLLLLKTTKGLLDAQVPIARIRKMLHSLKRQLPEDQQIWNVTIYADGRRVVETNAGSSASTTIRALAARLRSISV